MTLKRLEMQGFKSFAKRAVFDFSAPVTAIVGPNGSGKSNVVESIRFVLGEQSSKSLRSKSGADLIFKGSKQLGKLNRASVAITFDNSKRIFNLPSVDDQNLSLDFDEITISREVFADGLNKYSLNGNEVRLKDIHELIASVNIGSSGHHIISQGEADRLLNSKPVERREMLEESLGLKLYHYRIREAERKLEKTQTHLHEVESIRRELAPHIKFLKKQVEKIEKAREIEIALKDAYTKYLTNEQTLLAQRRAELERSLNDLHNETQQIEGELSQFQRNNSNKEITELESNILQARAVIRDLMRKRDDIGRQLGRIEGMMQGAKSVTTNTAVKVVDIAELEQFIEELESNYDLTVRELIQSLKEYVADKKGSKSEKVSVETTEFEITKQKLEDELKEIDNSLAVQEQTIQTTESQLVMVRESIREAERGFFEAQGKKMELSSKKNLLENAQHDLHKRLHDLQDEYLHAEQLVGSQMVDLKNKFLEPSELMDESALRTLHHEIERMKIRLEDMGGGGGGDVMQEYDETVTRDQFLEKEINDLYSAIETLTSTINHLKEKLHSEFKTGIVKINAEFENFFKLMFGGGEARLAIMKIQNKKKKAELDEEGNEIPVDEEDEKEEEGIEIDVSLPRKKVKDLEMLSGGERSLTSIALLFALSQVNPPPFLVLDETDAALDEANSQKYGDMIENLAKQTQLIVVTHNRETMSRADILYGVTLGSDDGSRLLSIKFEEAVKVAK